MREQIEMSRSMFYIIVGLCSAIIMLTSLETMMKAKDNGLFEMWLSNPNIQQKMLGQAKEQLHSTYITMCLSSFFVKVITPIGLAIHTYFTLMKLRVNKLYIVIWTLLLICSFVLSILNEMYFSIFFIISGICYVGLFIALIYLKKQISNIASL